jgi:hypothetical protein
MQHLLVHIWYLVGLTILQHLLLYLKVQIASRRLKMAIIEFFIIDMTNTFVRLIIDII